MESKLLLVKAVERPALVAAGFSLTLPTGSERRGLGGEAAIEPFVRGGVAVGEFDVLGEVDYELDLNAHVEGPRPQELRTGLAVAYAASRWFAPLLELTAVTVVRGRSEDADGGSLRGRTQVYLTPGFNVRPWPGMTLRAGLELPVTRARTFDYTLLGGVVKEF